MTDAPNRSATDAVAARHNRLRDALRENLKRRKSQSRGRADQPARDIAGDGGPRPGEAGSDVHGAD
ncbi:MULTISPECIES: hypothetical protein [Rhodopseudomonas]|uniref:Uncharacterized protein n=1 Tax=Rhodopseudomonas palustris TaxID=1076 RepID=A0A0D7EHK4_RHOPL|nr:MULTISPECIES: hypothetical protein [Rhodopseudomonas]KIZ40223.1 hypothetical protein OO17_18220 [Rhodopseudomonas palustris]MDF3808898.1 hypothetical protein [Rhodopseudomonas sp. BAL398]WOK15807.1 hypothetical protein RBJ75_16695 [Rhodopseudomonas sp. BAL398]